MSNPQIWLNGFVGLLLYLSLSAFAELWGIPYLEQARGFTKAHAAYANSMVFLGWAVGGPFWGLLSDLLRKRCKPIVISAILALTMACILLYVPFIPVPLVYISLFLFGLFSSVQILVFSICRETTHVKMAGTAIALTNLFVMLGGNLFQPVIGLLLDMGWSGGMLNGARIYSASTYQWALSVIPISILLAIIVMFFIKETHAKVKL